MDSKLYKEVDPNVQIDSSNSRIFDDQELSDVTPEKNMAVNDQEEDDDQQDQIDDVNVNKFVEEHK